MDYITYAVFLALAFTLIKSVIRVIVSLKVTLAMCGSLASTVSDREKTMTRLLDQSPVGSS